MKRNWVWLRLSNGKRAKVDRADFARLSAAWVWHYAHGYARRNRYSAAKYKRDPQSRGWSGWVYLHQEVLQTKHVDHRNGDGLDNRRNNLRRAGQTLNNANQRLRRDNTSGFKGVSIKRGRWAARIKVRGVVLCLGTFATPAVAAKAYDVAARRHFGEFARPNFGRNGVARKPETT